VPIGFSSRCVPKRTVVCSLASGTIGAAPIDVQGVGLVRAGDDSLVMTSILQNRQRRRSSIGMHTPIEYERIHCTQSIARLSQVS